MTQGIPRYPEGFFNGNSIPPNVLDLAHQSVMMRRAVAGSLGAAVLRHEKEGIDKVAVQPAGELDDWVSRYVQAYAENEGDTVEVLMLNEEGAQLVYFHSLANLLVSIQDLHDGNTDT